MDLSDRERSSCSILHKISFGLGHVYNDLCAAMWFSYTLFYFQVVLEVQSQTAGILLMIGKNLFIHYILYFVVVKIKMLILLLSS